MLRKLLCWFSCLFVWGVFATMAPAQFPLKKETEERRPPAPEYALAFVGTVLILLILVMPTRKGAN